MVAITIKATNAAGEDTAVLSLALVESFAAMMPSLPGLLAYFPQTEASGTTADNAEGTAARDGTYVTDENVTQQGATFPVGDAVALYNDAGYLAFGSEDLAAAWDWDHCWGVVWVKPDATEQADTSNHGWAQFSAEAGKTTLSLYKSTIPYQYFLDHRPDAATTGGRLYSTDWLYSPNYTLFAFAIDGAGNGRIWRNGVRVFSVSGIPASTDTTLDITNAYNNALAFLSGSAGAYPHLALGVDGALIDDVMDALYLSVYPDVQDMAFFGDSKVTSNDYFISKLLGNLEYAQSGTVYRENPYRVGLSGERVAVLYSTLNANIASYGGNPVHIVLEIGANDVSAQTIEATFKTGLTGCIDLCLATYPNAKIWLTQPYRNDVDRDAFALELAGWVKEIKDQYGQNVRIISNENEWYKANLDTLSDDDIHPNTAGNLAKADLYASVILNRYIKDLFTSDEAAGFTSPYAADVGRLVRVVDTNDVVELSDGLHIDGTADTAYSDPAYYWDDGYAPRGLVNGFTQLFTITPSADNEIVQVAVSDNTTVTDATQYGLRFYSDGKLYWTRAGTVWEIGVYDASTTYLIGLRQRDGIGMECWIKGGAYLASTLIFVDTLNPDAGAFVPCISISGTVEARVSNLLVGCVYRGTSDDSEFLVDTSPPNDVTVPTTAVHEGLFELRFTPPASPSDGDYMELDYNRHYSADRRIARIQWNAGTGEWDFVSGHRIASTTTLQGSPVANVGDLTRLLVRSIGNNNDFWGAVGDDYVKFYGTIVDAAGDSNFNVATHWVGDWTGVELRVWDSYDAALSDALDALATV